MVAAANAASARLRETVLARLRAAGHAVRTQTHHPHCVEVDGVPVVVHVPAQGLDPDARVNQAEADAALARAREAVARGSADVASLWQFCHRVACLLRRQEEDAEWWAEGVLLPPARVELNVPRLNAARGSLTAYAGRRLVARAAALDDLAAATAAWLLKRADRIRGRAVREGLNAQLVAAKRALVREFDPEEAFLTYRQSADQVVAEILSPTERYARAPRGREREALALIAEARADVRRRVAALRDALRELSQPKGA